MHGQRPHYADRPPGGKLVPRTEGDLLIRYDFGGNAGDIPVISLSRWDDTANDWTDAVDLPAGQAEALVYTGTAPITDDLAPPNTDAGSESLGTKEFGEAGIDLTAAGVFKKPGDPGFTCQSFGTTSASSRSAGSSNDSAMKDIAGPAHFTLQNCGTINIVKKTAPTNGINQNFSFTSGANAGGGTGTFAGTCTADTTPAAFTLNAANPTGGAKDTETCTDVPPGSYTVTEGANPTGFTFTDLSCTASGTGTSATPTGPQSATKTASITMAGGGSATCTYTNTQQLGAIKISKTSTKGDSPLNGATFSIKGPDGNAITGSPFTTAGTGANAGTVCVDNLAFGNYKVQETAAPTGYKINDTTERTVAVDNNAKCSDATFVRETTSFSDTPLSQVQVKFTSLAGAGVTKSAIVCTKGSPPTTVNPVSENGQADPAFDDTDETFTNLEPGLYTCTVDVDP